MPDRLVSKLHIKSWLNDSYSENNGSRCRFAPRPLYMDDGSVGSIIIKPKDQYMCGNYVFCFVFDCWMTLDGRWCCQAIFGRPDVARVMQLLEDSERLRVIPRILYLPPSVVTDYKLPGDWILHQETWARLFKDDNPNARPFYFIVVSSQSHEYS